MRCSFRADLWVLSPRCLLRHLESVLKRIVLPFKRKNGMGFLAGALWRMH